MVWKERTNDIQALLHLIFIDKSSKLMEKGFLTCPNVNINYVLHATITTPAAQILATCCRGCGDAPFPGDAVLLICNTVADADFAWVSDLVDALLTTAVTLSLTACRGRSANNAQAS